MATPISTRRPGLRTRIALIVLLVIVTLVAGVLYSQRELVGALWGSRFVGGDSGAANLHLPPGFHAAVFYNGLAAPRFIAFSPDGTLFVAESATGSIVALPDPGHTGKAQRKIVVASGLDHPTSLVFYNGMLYVVSTVAQNCRQTRTRAVRAALIQSGVPSVPATFQGVSGSGHVRESMQAGTSSLWTSS